MVLERRFPVLVAIVGFLTAPTARTEERIRDNLFLLEEAYNQEPGVIQHISAFQMTPNTKEWSYSFTDEWPVLTDLHQLSVTINVFGLPQGGGASFGDLFLNYRIQALGLGGTGPVAMAPRLSLVLPTGSASKGTGRGAIGLQFNLPVSIEIGPYFVTHLNAGMTVTPSAHAPGGRTESTLDASAGFALVWQPASFLNPLVEVAYLNEEDLSSGGSRRMSTLMVNPGLRVAIDVPGTGLQIVPGIGVPMMVWPRTDFSVSVIGYLSLEHPAFEAPRGDCGHGGVAMGDEHD